MLRELQTRAADGDQNTPSCATRETPDGEVSQSELQRHTYQREFFFYHHIIQDDILKNSPYCKIKDVERIVKQERTEPGRGRDNRASRKTDENVVIGRVNEAYHEYTEPPGKL